MKIKYLFAFLFILAFVGAAVSISHAQSQNDNINFANPDTTGSAPPPDTTGSAPAKTTPIPALQNPLRAKSVTDLLFTVVDLMIFLGVIVAVFMFVFIGFKYVLAQGNATKIAEIHKWFLYAAVGTAVLISSKVIVEVIKNTFISAGIVNQDAFNKPKT